MASGSNDRQVAPLKILFMGRKASAAHALDWLMGQGFDVVGVLTDNHLPNSPTTRIARKWNIPVLSIGEVYERIQAGTLAFDLGISFVYWKILKEPLISFPRYGVINFHPAPLPDYRGLAGYNLAILEGLDHWGVTAHYINSGIDTGPIIDVFKFSIDPNEETVTTLERTSQDFMVRLFKKTVRRVDEARSRLETRENTGGRSINRQEFNEIRKVNDGDDVHRKIRAFWFPPYHGAFIEINGEEFTLVNDQVLQDIAKAYARASVLDELSVESLSPERRSGLEREGRLLKPTSEN
jgi:methionyl-tRNA formyltransferase